MTHKHSIRIVPNTQGKAAGHRLYLDDVDISGQVLGLDIGIHPDKGNPIPQLVIRIIPDAFSSEMNDIPVRLHQENHDLLVRLGWTPPPEEAP